MKFMSHLRAAVISDIHGNNQALTSVLEDIQTQEITNIIIAGDSTGPNNQNQVFKTLIDKKAIMIRGNGEKRIVGKQRGQIANSVWNQTSFSGNRWVYNDLESSIKNLLEFLPDQRVVSFEGTSPIRVVHGSPQDSNNSKGILPDQTSSDSKKLIRVHSTIPIEEAVIGVMEKVLICGHTHRPWVRRINDILVVNPGSVGNPCNGDPRADYAVLSWEDGLWNVEHKAVGYDLDSVYSDFKESGFLELVGAFARSTLLCRMTGVDVTLEFLLYVKDFRDSFDGSLSYDQAYTAAVNSFDWKQYENF
jgi:predicted phosphodiesterase